MMWPIRACNDCPTEQTSILKYRLTLVSRRGDWANLWNYENPKIHPIVKIIAVIY